jgi:uncharacterized protein (DUF1778 family)
MLNKGGRPVKAHKLDQTLKLRMDAAEKQAFSDAANVAGIPVSTWMRERLRRAAARELGEVSRPIAFLPPVETDRPQP